MADQVPVAASLAYRVTTTASLRCMACCTVIGTDAGRAGTEGSRVNDAVTTTVNMVFWAVAVACLSRLAYGTATGKATGRTDVAGRRKKDPVSASPVAA